MPCPDPGRVHPGDDQLQFGALDHAVALRWRTVHVRDTPTAAALHSPSQTFLLLTEAADGICWLRLMSATTLQQVWQPRPPAHPLQNAAMQRVRRMTC